MVFPDELVQQFRTVALERLDRIEQAWGAVMANDADAATVVHREVHTLKGESRMLGFSDVNLVCHKLEDMLEVARARGYAIDEDFDLAVNMATRFMAMLVRKRIGSQLVGIDLPGFVKQIDGLLAELRPEPARAIRTTTGQMPALKVQPGLRVPQAVRARLGPIAVDSFVEYAIAHGRRRGRLRTSWHALRDLIGFHRAVRGPNQLAKHEAGAHELASSLGKQVAIRFDLASVEATADIVAAVDSAMLHLVRNAVDHGIEPAADRTAAGKPALGTIHVAAHQDGDRFVMTVDDDGGGIALDEVRRCAIARGLLAADDTSIEDRWLDLICQPGFTTRVVASDVSGRGVGLDVVRVSVQELGGALTAQTTAGRGTSWRIELPLPKVTVGAMLFRVPHLPFPVAVDSTWSVVADAPGAPVHDLAHVLGITDEPAAAQRAYFRRGDVTVGIAIERAPQAAEVRRLVAAVPPAIADIIVTEAAEGLLVQPQRLSR